MSFSLSRGRPLDVTGVGIDQNELPPLSDEDRRPLDLRGWFDEDLRFRGHPLELEIGSGKGTFLVQQATRAAGVNYIGIEWARAFWRSAADRVRRHHLRNVKLLHTEAGAFIRNYVAPGTFRTVHIYFPDPWPKARHNKRRLIQAPFLRELHRVLTPPPDAGTIRIATDHSDYFAWMQDHIGQVADLFETLPFNTLPGVEAGELVGTNFERKYRREGRPFHAIVLRRK